MEKELLIATIEHRLFYDPDTKQHRSSIRLVPGMLDSQKVAMRMAILTAAIKKQIDVANQVIDDATVIKEIEKEATKNGKRGG